MDQNSFAQLPHNLWDPTYEEVTIFLPNMLEGIGSHEVVKRALYGVVVRGENVMG